MANNLDFSQLEKIMSMEAKKFTPEYMEQLSKSAYKEDREYFSKLNEYWRNFLIYDIFIEIFQA